MLYSFLILISLNCQADADCDSLSQITKYYLINENPKPALFTLKQCNKSNITSEEKLIEYYNMICEALIQSGDMDSSSNLLKWMRLTFKRINDEGKVYMQINEGDISKQTRSAIQIIDLEESMKKLSENNHYLLGKGNFLIGYELNASNPQKALNALKTSLSHFKNNNNLYAFQISKVYAELGYGHRQLTDYNEALEYYDSALNTLDLVPFDKIETKVKYTGNIGNLHYENGNYPKAKKWLEESYKIRSSHIKDSLMLMVSLNNLATFYMDFGNYLRAEEKYLDAFTYEAGVNNKHILGSSHNNYGVIKLHQCQLSTMLKHLKIAEKYYIDDKGENNQALIPVYINMAEYFIANNDLLEARRYINLADKISSLNKTEFNLNEGKISFQYGRLGMNLELYDLAIEQFTKSLHIYKALFPDGHPVIGDIYNNLGLIKMNRKRFSEANNHFRKSLEIYLEFNEYHNPKICLLYNNLGELKHDQGEIDSAVFFLQTSINHNYLDVGEESRNDIRFPEYSDPMELMTSYFFLSSSYYKRYYQTDDLKDLMLALQYISIGFETYQVYRGTLENEIDQMWIGNFGKEYVSGAMDIMYKVYSVTKDESILANTFEFSEASKSQALLRAMNLKRIKAFANISEELLREEERIDRHMIDINKQLTDELSYGELSNDYLLSEYRTEFSSVRKHYKQFLDSIKDNLPDYYNLKFNKKLVSVDDLQKDVIPDGKTAMIQYFIGDTTAYAQLILKDQMYICKIQGVRSLKNDISKYRNILYEGKRRSFIEESNKLYRQLIYPVDSIIRNNHKKVTKLIIITDDFLGYLPFESLCMDKEVSDLSDMPYLIDRYQISYGYSSTLLWQMSQRKTSDDISFIGFAPSFDRAIAVSDRIVSRNTDFNPEAIEKQSYDSYKFIELNETNTEVVKIAEKFKRKKQTGTVISGLKANEETLKGTNLWNYNYVHFATHGFVNLDQPELSGIAFSRTSLSGEDDLLFADEVYSLNLNADLVTLSACETGIGKLYKGEGIIGLIRGFLYAGCKNVLVSLWNVPDKSTSELMINFYDKILRKHDRSAALRKAKLEMKKNPDYAHPYYWAPFVLIGN